MIRKDGKKDEGLIDKATVFRGWEDFKDDEKWFSVSGLQDIPDDSPWAYHTNYFAHMEWDLDDPEKQIERGRLIDDWQQYQDAEDEDENELGSVED